MENKNTNTTNGSVLANEKRESHMMNGKLTYEDKVIQKVIGCTLKDVSDLLALDGGFFSSMAEKLVNTDNITAGINAEVGKKQVAVDLDVIVKYGKNIKDIYNQIKELVSTEVNNMTHLDVIEVNANVADIKTQEEYQEDQETVQDKITETAKSIGQFASRQTDRAKSAVGEDAQKVKENGKPHVQ